MKADLYLYLFAALGAFTHWMVLQYGNRFDSAAERLITEVVKERKWLKFLAIALFVAVGAIFSVTMVEPTTIKQALAAGMAWTTLLGIRAPKKKA